MKIGTQIEAKDGFKELKSNVVYYFVKNNPKKSIVLLAQFVEGKSYDSVMFITMKSVNFEAAVIDGSITECEDQKRLPPWMSEIEEADFQDIEDRRDFKKVTNREKAQQRYRIISEAIDNWQEILEAKDIAKKLNEFATRCEPIQNLPRFRLWVMTYMCHGMQLEALVPKHHRLGRWDRGLEKYRNTHFGPKGASGRRNGYCSSFMVEQIISGYQKHAKKGVRIAEIYKKSLRSEFNCKTQKVAGSLHCSQPDGMHYPTYSQFYYQVMRYFDPVEVKGQIHGPAYVREHKSPSKGRFSHELANVMEKIEVDGYRVQERPKSYSNSNQTLSSLIVIRGVCATTSACIGIGFSYGGEDAEAYRLMLFSAAIMKSKFLQIMGIHGYDDEDWPMNGLPMHYLSDRGPGASKKVFKDTKHVIAMKEIAPSYQGQSKATVESSHRRTTTRSGQPHHMKSGLSLVELAKQEVIETVLSNKKKSVDGRLIGIEGGSKVMPNPIEVWKKLSSIGRDSSVQITFDEAVRSFLNPIELKMQADELIFKSRVYDSEDLRNSGIYEELTNHAAVKIHGYCYPIAMRYCWIEYRGKLIEVEVKFDLRNQESAKEITLDELELEHIEHKVKKSELKDFAVLAEIQAAEIFERNTDKAFRSGVLTVGRGPSNAKLNKHEENKAIKSVLKHQREELT